MPRKKTQQEFIADARKVHGDRYDYSKSEYRGSDSRICIICPKHGEFWQVPHAHLRGQGCPTCSGKNQSSEDFIAKARIIHDGKYDYSKVSYLSANNKVCIICRIHGEFWQTPNNHLSGRGCPICAGNVRLTNKGFIDKAQALHGNKYDYSKVEYHSTQTKVCIICPEHGEFWQTPNNHLNGQGCPICGGSFPMTRDSFIIRARGVYGWKYDYSKVEYRNNQTKICIVCPKHGEFWQTPGSHLGGCGCPECANESRAEKKRFSLDEFLLRARALYGFKYDYSKVDYKNKDTKVCIICPEHGEFWQLPGHHLRGHQCPACSGVSRITTEDFIKKAKAIHGEKYDYSNVEYVNAYTPVAIGCSVHGSFFQIPGKHLMGRGCPFCNSSHLEEELSLAFNENGILFERQKGFVWLRDQKPLKLDYYLPDYHLAIECQGLQHFEPVDFFGGLDSYEDNIARDSIKKKLCEGHGITVLYFSNLGIDYPYQVYEDKDELLNAIKQSSTK